jgi:hypothetical protein
MARTGSRTTRDPWRDEAANLAGFAAEWPQSDPGGLQVGGPPFRNACRYPAGFAAATKPSRPRGDDCCFFSSFKTLLTFAEGDRPRLGIKVLVCGLSLAGLQSVLGDHRGLYERGREAWAGALRGATKLAQMPSPGHAPALPRLLIARQAGKHLRSAVLPSQDLRARVTPQLIPPNRCPTNGHIWGSVTACWQVQASAVWRTANRAGTRVHGRRGVPLPVSM